MSDIYQLLPAFKEYIWAGTKLKKYKKTNLSKIAECWELSFLDEGPTKIINEHNELVNLKDVVDKFDLGDKSNNYTSFPVLIKLIDSGDSLSIQVHPSDEYALKNENTNGKIEMWIILDADVDSFIYYGFNEDVKKDELKTLISNDSVLDILNKVYVKKGDIFLIKPGTIHAIGKGITLLEIQESSNITYRLYDFNREDKNGKRRELHIDKAIDVINFKKTIVHNLSNNNEIKTEYFDVMPLKINYYGKKLLFKDTFSVVTIIDGDGYINNIKAEKYHSYFVKANKEFSLKGNMDVVITKLP